MSKKLKPDDRKGIVITNDAPLHVYGGIRGPIKSMYYETVEKIATILSDNAKVVQVTSKGEKIDLDFTNFDKDLDPYDDEIDEVLELITCTPDRIIVLEATKTATINTNVEQCKFESLNDKIATVAQNGVVTGVDGGETSIRVSKSGYRTVSVPVKVKERPEIKVVPEWINKLKVGEEITLTTDPSDVKFKTEDEVYANVNDRGVVRGIAGGSTTVIVSKDGYKDAKVPVTVVANTMQCTPSTVEELYVGDTQKIITEPKTSLFSSGNSLIAKVSGEGEITGVRAGETTVTVSKQGYYDVIIPVTVKDKPTIKCTPSEILELQVGLEETITTEPTGATFRSENEEFAKVNEQGVVTGVKEGTANIVVTKDGHQDAKVKVTVIPKKVVTCDPATIAELVVGQTQQITATPDNATFRLESEGIITVTERGLVEAVAEGQANVIVEAEGYESTTVTVTTKNNE